MADRMIEGLLTIGSSVPNLAECSWKDAIEEDRSAADAEYSGDPIIIKKGGSGSIRLLAGLLTSGHAAGGGAVFQYKQKSYAAGVESEATRTVTFTKVTLNAGGKSGATVVGEKTADFNYATSTEV